MALQVSAVKKSDSRPTTSQQMMAMSVITTLAPAPCARRHPADPVTVDVRMRPAPELAHAVGLVRLRA